MSTSGVVLYLGIFKNGKTGISDKNGISCSPCLAFCGYSYVVISFVNIGHFPKNMAL